MSKDTIDKPKHPIQPLRLDDHGVLRFKQNAIVRYLLDCGTTDLNKIACIPFSREDRVQFAQLIGYSLSGFSELADYVTNEDYETALLSYKKGVDSRDARIETLENELKAVKDAFREGVANLYNIHPDDLR